MLIQVTNVHFMIINFKEGSEIFDNLENLESSIFYCVHSWIYYKKWLSTQWMWNPFLLKGSVKPVNNINISDSILWVLNHNYPFVLF